MSLSINTAASDALASMLSSGKQIRQACVTYMAACDAGSLKIGDLTLGFLGITMKNAKTNWAIWAAVSGIGAAVEAKFGYAGGEGDTRIASVQTAIQNFINTMEGASGVPTDASDHPAIHKMAKNGNGTVTERTITNAGQLAQFKTTLQSLRDAFDP